jgi:hypothetical protein
MRKVAICFFLIAVVIASRAQGQHSSPIERPLQLMDVKFSSEERRIITDALNEKADGALRLVSLAKTHIMSEQSITLADAIIVHGALMMANDTRATSIIKKLREVLKAQAAEAK